MLCYVEVEKKEKEGSMRMTSLRLRPEAEEERGTVFPFYLSFSFSFCVFFSKDFGHIIFFFPQTKKGFEFGARLAANFKKLWPAFFQAAVDANRASMGGRAVINKSSSFEVSRIWSITFSPDGAAQWPRVASRHVTSSLSPDAGIWSFSTFLAFDSGSNKADL